MAARHPLNHPPTAICDGKHDNDEDPSKTRVLVADPDTGRGFVYSTDQTAKGRPEFLFLDTLGDPMVMVSLSRIISDYDENNALPCNQEVIHRDPFYDGFPLTFIVRVIDGNNQPLKRYLEVLYLHANSEYGIVVLIPFVTKDRVVTESGKLWRCGPIPIPDDHTNEALDAWISATARIEANGVSRLQEFLARQGHLPGQGM